MISRSLLSKAQTEYFTSRTDEITNLSEQKDRISTSTEQAFNAFKILLNSDKTKQEFRDKLFPSKKVNTFISLLTNYNDDNTVSEESNKQEIVIGIINTGLQYLKQRYKTTKFVSKELSNFSRLLEDILELTQSEIKQQEDIKHYEIRMHPNLPFLPPQGKTWSALCISCLSYTTLGENEKDSMKRVQHTRGCAFHKQRKTDKRIYEQYFKIIPPEEKN